ncbi:jasmonate Zim-domain protein [Striga asiatica]|uniref:Jasmonate Zim-domain protein n=1 Tax=Striga asiatica TaxID=4170 RepID=A0A5A7P3H1_STRAF|nr:jasmonate Zim-domain protein [Striga asiatica]
MEIDFLGLNSSTTARPSDNIEEQYGFKDAAIFSAANLGVETSLSLSTAPSLSCKTEILNFSEKKEKKLAEFYYLNHTSTQLRKASQIPAEAALISMITDNLQEKAAPRLSDHARICRTIPGYTPTVAMARRATLARFLEKRLHRMNKARKAHIMGKSINAANRMVKS